MSVVLARLSKPDVNLAESFTGESQHFCRQKGFLVLVL